MYDIKLLTTNLQKGLSQAALSGFTAFAPSRRSARSRAEDMLILSFDLWGDGDVAELTQKDWLENTIHSFFRTSGSVTSAMRSIIETVNMTLMEKNVKPGREIGPMTAAINLAVIHRHILYIAQSGPTHAFVINQRGLMHFTDPNDMDRGLGLSRALNIRYYQADIGDGCYFFTTESPPDMWTEESLFKNEFPKFEQLRRRLLNQSPSEFNVDLAQIIPGNGQITKLNAQTLAEPVGPTSSKVSEIDSTANRNENMLKQESDELFETQEIKNSTEVSQEYVDTNQIEDQVDDADSYSEPVIEEPTIIKEKEEKSTRPDESIVQHKASHRDEVKSQTSLPKKEKPNRKKQKKLFAESRQIRERSLDGLAAFFLWWRNIREKIDGFFNNAFNRWNPSDSDGGPGLSRRTLLIVAIITPLLLAGVAAIVYFARGRNIQYQYYFEQAQLSSETAMSVADPNQSREAWNQVLSYLNEAESYRETDQIVELRQQARDSLDALDGAVRLDYQPAIIGSLYSEILITNIISYGPDLYLLDSAGGRVIHAARMSQGYEVDPDFVCAQGNYGGVRVEAIVDMVALPLNNPFQAHILAIDANGNAAYCGPDQNPIVHTLPSLSGNEGVVSNIAYDNNYLYALSPANNTIYVYRPTNGQFLDSPSNFFEDVDLAEIPNLNEIVDIAVNGPDLYLLKANGTLVDCTTSSLSGNQVTCADPVDYIDGRPGKEEQFFTIPDSDYRGLLYTSPPDPSISILDAQNADIYRFSLRFRLHERLRPDMGAYELESPTATAFTIGIDRIAFLAFGHQVFYAYVD